MCTACSTPVIEAYRQDPVNFVRRVCELPKYLEEISGVADMVKGVKVDDFLYDDDDDLDSDDL
jgi:hypothetical protein